MRSYFSQLLRVYTINEHLRLTEVTDACGKRRHVRALAKLLGDFISREACVVRYSSGSCRASNNIVHDQEAQVVPPLPSLSLNPSLVRAAVRFGPGRLRAG